MESSNPSVTYNRLDRFNLNGGEGFWFAMVLQIVLYDISIKMLSLIRFEEATFAPNI